MAGMAKLHPGLVHVALLLLMSALIGAMFPMLKVAEHTIPPLTITLLRVSLATVTMLLTVAVVMKRSLVPLGTHWKTFVLLGLMLGLFLVSVSEAEERIPASLGALMGCIVPSATFLITTVVLRWERFSWLRFAGTLVALAGMLLFIGTDGLNLGRTEWTGVAIMASGYTLYAINLIYAKFRNLDPFITATGTLFFATLFVAVAAFYLEQPTGIRPSAESLIAIVCVGVFSTGLTYLLLYYLIANAGPVFAATSGYLFPIVALLLSHFMLGETVGTSHIVGMAVTVTGAWLINRKSRTEVAG